MIFDGLTYMISFRKKFDEGLINNIMKERKLKRSRQRDQILDILRNTDTHPTASWIYDELKKHFKNLSMGTVYRNVNILIKQGLITKIESGSTFDRFDANTEPHYHFFCQQCDTVSDIPIAMMEELNEKANSVSKHLVKEHQIYFYGLCENCKNSEPVS